MKKVLVTGGFGYLGGRISQALQKSGFQVILGSRFDRPSPSWLPTAQVFKLDYESQISLPQDISSIVHLTAANENVSLQDPQQALIATSLYTLKLLQASEEINLERFVYMSTAHVYGAPLVGHITEDTLPRPIHPYAITHKTAEDFVLASHAQKKLDGVVLRLSNAFGAPADPKVDRWTLLVNDLCKQAATIKKLQMRSSGAQHRDFISMLDVCNAVTHVLNLPSSGLTDGLFNLGGGQSNSARSVAQLVVEGCEKVLNFKPLLAFPESASIEPDGKHVDYDINKFMNTGFQLKGSMKQEIEETLLFCSKHFVEEQHV